MSVGRKLLNLLEKVALRLSHGSPSNIVETLLCLLMKN